MNPAILVQNLNKIYDNNFQALKDINLEIMSGEILALLGPNGAGKTTLINAICGIVQYNSGQISVSGFDAAKNYRQARACIGLVPQELTTDAFETVWNTVSFSRGLFGKPKNPQFIETLLKRLSLWDKKDNQLRKLSGGMKRRVMIAKALSHEPQILFLDEPSAGVDVELRKSMWDQVRDLRQTGVTVILTTHYIEEAEEIADRVGVINKGELILIQDKSALMKKLGNKELRLDLNKPMLAVPNELTDLNLTLKKDGCQLVFSYDSNENHSEVGRVLERLQALNITFKDLSTQQSSLEEIFVQLVGDA